jgi:hypothetical protein
VRVKVRGSVRDGDYIIPSGLHDGTGAAIPPGSIRSDQYAQVVGRAWESFEEDGVKVINTAVGLPLSSANPTLESLIHLQQQEIAALKGEVLNLRQKVEQL